MRAVIVSAVIAFLVSILGTPLAIKAFTRLKAGQPIRDINPAGHNTKRGTPTMGGLVFIAATLVAYIAGHLILKTLSKNYIVPPGPTITSSSFMGVRAQNGSAWRLSNSPTSFCVTSSCLA